MKKFLLYTLLLLIPLGLKSQSILLPTTWSNGCYYNYYQPSDIQGPCGKCFVSSTAVAMGQIMKYWQHPNKGWGEMSFTPYLYGTQSANFEHNYNWENMPNILNNDNQDVSRLLSDLEVSITTNYSPYFYNYSCGLVNLDTVRISLNSHFGYKNGQVIHRNTNQQFDSLIINEINNNRHVIMEVYPYNNQCSKFCVVDGYNPTTQKFHINWCYSTYWNVWSELDTIPFVYTNWGLYTHALIGIEPDTMNVTINVKYDLTNDSIPSTLCINDSTYDLPEGTIDLTLKKNWYDVSLTTNEPWGNVNSVDALIIMKHFVMIQQLTGLKMICADVTNNNNINSLDALMDMKRFVGSITGFPSGDWKFQNVKINNQGIWTIYGRCVGDTN